MKRIILLASAFIGSHAFSLAASVRYAGISSSMLSTLRRPQSKCFSVSMKAFGVGDTLDGSLPLFVREEKNGSFQTSKYTAAELFGGIINVRGGSGKRAVIFAVPGAFTPTCSETHVPGYVQLRKDFAAAGIDVVACVSVNDPFVMREWGKALGVGPDVLLLSDGNGDFSQGVGKLVDKRAGGMGMRSSRYAMVLDRQSRVQVLEADAESFAEPILRRIRALPA